jgi:hypothetical protein
MNTLKEQGLSIPPSKAKNVSEETKNPKENIGSASCGREGQNIPGETTTPEETQCLTRAEAKPQNAPENRGLLKTTGARCSRQRITRCFGTDSHSQHTEICTEITKKTENSNRSKKLPVACKAHK